MWLVDLRPGVDESHYWSEVYGITTPKENSNVKKTKKDRERELRRYP